MPYFKTSHEWVEQSNLLLQAQPTTTRITTKYSIKKPSVSASSSSPEAATKPPRAELVLKTHDTASGVTLKYRTTKAAEVSRLVYASLGRLGRGMAAVPEPPPEEAMPDAPAKEEDERQTQQPQRTQGGGKKKKKGKK